ncbi:MAG: universal stress protein [Alphaproteobacteria bacterium]|nr:universal stress protein [Alphaproteobacteria bacterium]
MNRFKKIICVVADGCANEQAITRAVTLAAHNSAQLTVLEVVCEIPPNTKLLDRTLFPDIEKKFMLEKAESLEAFVTPWRHKVPLTTKISSGILFLDVIREVLRSNADLVIKATENDTFLNRVFGSDDMHLTRKCPCPVWLVNSAFENTLQRIVAAIDVDECCRDEEIDTQRNLNRKILQIASSMAQREKAELHIVHVRRTINEAFVRAGLQDTLETDLSAYLEVAHQRHLDDLQKVMGERIQELDQKTVATAKPNIHWLEGTPQDEIASFSKNIKADLLVMGTVARTGIPGLFMGNTAEAILNRIECSLLAVKPAGFVSPVTIED